MLFDSSLIKRKLFLVYSLVCIILYANQKQRWEVGTPWILWKLWWLNKCKWMGKTNSSTTKCNHPLSTQLSMKRKFMIHSIYCQDSEVAVFRVLMPFFKQKQIFNLNIFSNSWGIILWYVNAFLFKLLCTLKP